MGKNSSRFYFHFLNVPQLVTEVHANPVDRAAVLGKRSGIAFLPNLCQCLVRAAVQLEFHDVHVVLCLEHQVNPTAARVVFHLHVEAHQLEDDVQDVLVMHLAVAGQLIGDVGEHRLQAVEEIVYLARHHFLHEALDLIGRLAHAHRRIVGQQENVFTNNDTLGSICYQLFIAYLITK